MGMVIRNQPANGNYSLTPIRTQVGAKVEPPVQKSDALPASTPPPALETPAPKTVTAAPASAPSSNVRLLAAIALLNSLAAADAAAAGKVDPRIQAETTDARAKANQLAMKAA